MAAAVPSAGAAQVVAPPPAQAVHPLLQGLVVVPSEDTGPAVEDSLSACVDDFWSRAVSSPESLALGDAYQNLLRPANLLNAVKTEINPELKQALPKGTTIRDLNMKTTQNAFLKATYGVTSMLHSIMTVQDLSETGTRQQLVTTGSEVLKALAFGSAKVNANRRAALKSQLARPFRHLCELKQSNHSFLLGADLSKSVKDATEASKLSASLAIQRRRGRRGKPGGYRHRQHRGNLSFSGSPRKKGGEC